MDFWQMMNVVSSMFFSMGNIVTWFCNKLNISQEIFTKYFSNSAWIMSEQISRIILGAFVLGWQARYLGPSLFGDLFYAIALGNYFVPLIWLSHDQIIVRELV